MEGLPKVMAASPWRRVQRSGRPLHPRARDGRFFAGIIFCIVINRAPREPESFLIQGEAGLARAFSKQLMVFAILLSVLTCFCWAQVEVEGCHASQAVTDCCCAERDALSSEATVLVYVFNASVPKLPDSDEQTCSEYASAFFLKTDPLFDRTDRSSPLRSRCAPSRYLLNASFLI